MSLSFVIPWWDSGDPYRLESMRWNFVRVMKLFPGCDLNCDGPSTWSRGQARNVGAKAALGETLAIVDSDTVFNKETIEAGLDMLDSGAPWVFPFSTYYRVSESSSAAILESPPESDLSSDGLECDYVLTTPPQPGYDAPEAGVLMIRKEDFLNIGGYCPGFQGWGYEDRGFVEVADRLLGPHERYDAGEVFHLWHPEPQEMTWNQPWIDANRALLERMKSADNEQLLRINRGE